MRQLLVLGLVLVFSLSSLTGCKKKEVKSGPTDNQEFLGGDEATGGDRGPVKIAPDAEEGGAKAPAPEKPVARPPMERKIQYTGHVELVVDDFSQAVRELEKLIKANKGYTAASEVRNNPGKPRFSNWKLRIPVNRFDEFRSALVKLGETTRNVTDSRDVTGEFYDLQARIRNKDREEQELQKLFKRSSGKLEDVLKVGEQLTRVRTDLDQLHGRLQELKDLTALTTLDVTLRERGSYVPEESPSFGTSIERTFDDSVQALVAFGKAVVLAAVAVAPWLPIALVVGIPAWLVLRWYGRRRHMALAKVPQPTPPPAPAAEA
jgi:hypothetical protein